MTDWTDIHPEFTKELQAKWEKLGFNWKQVEKWVEKVGLEPNDADFALYLGERGYTVDEVEEDELGELRTEYNEAMKKNSSFPSQEVILPDKDWKNIHS